jgi:flagellar basal-body rod modification protein FlgD
MSGSIAQPAGPVSAATAAARPRFSADLDSFLKLLTTQLRNQDPTKAMDSQQMTQQLVQFASVEQQLAVNSNLERLIAIQQGEQLVAAAPLVGRVLEVQSDRLALQQGAATIRLPAAGAARSARVEILDAQGRTIRTTDLRLGSTATDWRWDGVDRAQLRRPDGTYGLRVTGFGAQGEAAPVTATVLARATAVERQDGEVRLMMGGLAVPFSNLRSVINN